MAGAFFDSRFIITVLATCVTALCYLQSFYRLRFMRRETEMKHITTRQFSVLADCGKIYQFMLDIYERDWKNGVPAPFFEYAFSSFAYWMDITYSYKNRIWEDNGRIVAFCFYENPMTDIYFSLKPGYEELASEMIAYADAHMSVKGGEIQLMLFGGQDALMNAAKQAGYHQNQKIEICNLILMTY